MVKQTIQIFGRMKPTKNPAGVYSLDNDELMGASLEFVLPKDLTDGFVNNKRESYRFRFKKVFDQQAKQEDIFKNIAKPVADRRSTDLQPHVRLPEQRILAPPEWQPVTAAPVMS
uniref:Kinesin family member 6 n=1 Tax=Oryzias melastigma TaxID=30732 RepID=A0A3B3DBP9_ORYME